MVTPIFFRDNHAGDIPLFHSISENECSELLQLISQYYAINIKKTSIVRAVNGANLNSKNFIIDNFYVKIIALGNNVNDLDVLPGIAEKLLNSGIPAGKFIKNFDGEYLTYHSNNKGVSCCIYLQDFVQGKFYSGQPAQLKSCIDLALRLPAAVSDLKPSDKQLNLYKNWNPREIIQMVDPLICSAKKLTLFDKVANHYYAVAKDIVLSDSLSGLPSKLNHIDLHPHNILMRSNSVVCLLDLESFWAVPENVSIGFGLYKLARKSIANGLMTINQAHALLSDSLDVKKLVPYAQLEVARRFLTILKLHYVDENYRWDSDISKHGSGFVEIEKIFLS